MRAGCALGDTANTVPGGRFVSTFDDQMLSTSCIRQSNLIDGLLQWRGCNLAVDRVLSICWT